MQTTFDGARMLRSDLDAARLVGLRQWRSNTRDWRMHRCCRRLCGGVIWPGVLHHHVITDARERRIHRRCPGEERDPFPEYGPADRGVAAVDWLLMAAGIAIAVAAWVAVALVLAFG